MRLKSIWKSWKFSRKFLVIIAVAVLISTLALFQIIQIQEKMNLAEREQAQINVAQSYVVSNLETMFEKLRGYANLIANNAEIAEALYYANIAGETDELHKQGEKYLKHLDITNFEVLNTEGEVLVALATPDEVGTNRSQLKLFEKAMAGEITTSIQEGKKGFAFEGSSPIFNQEELIGVLLISSYIVDTYCCELSESTGFDAFFVIDGEIIGCSDHIEKGQQLKVDEIALSTNGQSYDGTFEGERYRLLAAPIKDEFGNNVANAVIGMNMAVADVQATKRVWKALSTLAIVLVVVLLLAYPIAKYTVKPLSEMAQAVKEVAEGDLTQEMDYMSGDEIGNLAGDFRDMVENLRQMIGQTISSSKTIDKATECLIDDVNTSTKSTEMVADTLKTLKEDAGKQKDEIEIMSSQLSELNSAAQEIAAAAENTSTTATEVYKTAEEGGHAVSNAVNVMKDIQSSSSSAVQTVSQLSEEAKKIGDIVKTITTIADQTNLLALNAAIEAARAGEAGRGFAVVADEVRKLAENSAGSAGEITQLIKGIQASIDKVVQVIQEGNEKAVKGGEVMNQVGGSLDNILTSIRNISDKITDISAAAEQQSSSFTTVVSSMENVSSIVASTADKSTNAAGSIDDTLDLAQNLNKSSVDMKQMAKDLISLMSYFKISEEDSLTHALKLK